MQKASVQRQKFNTPADFMGWVATQFDLLVAHVVQIAIGSSGSQIEIATYPSGLKVDSKFALGQDSSNPTSAIAVYHQFGDLQLIGATAGFLNQAMAQGIMQVLNLLLGRSNVSSYFGTKPRGEIRYYLHTQDGTTDLSEQGLAEVSFVPGQNMFIGRKPNDNKLYTLSLADARSGGQQWKSTSATQQSPITALPARISADGLDCVVITRADGIEVLDLSGIGQGRIKSVAFNGESNDVTWRGPTSTNLAVVEIGTPQAGFDRGTYLVNLKGGDLSQLVGQNVAQQFANA